MHPNFERTWEPDDVEAELRSAIEIVERLDPPEDLRQLVYSNAAALLTQRAQRVHAGGLQIPGGLLG